MGIMAGEEQGALFRSDQLFPAFIDPGGESETPPWRPHILPHPSTAPRSFSLSPRLFLSSVRDCQFALHKL